MKASGLVNPLRKVITFCAAGLLLSGCASAPRPPEAFLDSPAHHIANGFTLINSQRLEAAEREFELALRHDPKSTAARRGIALVYGMKGDYNPAFESMGLAYDHAVATEDKALAQVGLIRLQTMERGKDWLVKAERSFSRIMSSAGDVPEAYYYMGLAYKQGYRMEEAAKAFHGVPSIHGNLFLKAGHQLRVIEKIKRASPETEVGKRIAVLDWVTRADVAALMIRELKLDQDSKKVYPRRQDVPLPPDAKDHFFKEEIRRVLGLDIQGLRIQPDNTFGPDDAVTRAEYAMMIAAIIVKVRKDASLVSRYAGVPSPFEDVPEYAPYYGAVMVCHAWGPIIEPDHDLFGPLDRLSGADAVLSVRRLREKLDQS